MVSFGMEDFEKRFGNLQPSQFVDIISLVGDSSDNIPGTLYLSLYLSFVLFVVNCCRFFSHDCEINVLMIPIICY
jgi:5'-3' exonuclease